MDPLANLDNINVCDDFVVVSGCVPWATCSLMLLSLICRVQHAESHVLGGQVQCFLGNQASEYGPQLNVSLFPTVWYRMKK